MPIAPFAIQAGAALLIYSSCTCAQVVRPVEFVTESAMMAPRGEVQGCGLRFVATDINQAATNVADAVDGSLMTFAAGFGAVKAGLWTVRVASGKVDRKARKESIKWIKVDGQKPIALEDGKSVPSQDVGFAMYTADMLVATSSLIAMSEGKNLWVSFAASDQRSTIYSGPVKIEPSTLEQFKRCIASLAETIEQQ